MTSVIEIVGETFHEWSEDKASRLSAALAYYTVFSIPPLMVVAIGIASLFTDRATIEEQVVNQAGSLMGQQGAEGDSRPSFNRPNSRATANCCRRSSAWPCYSLARRACLPSCRTP